MDRDVLLNVAIIGGFFTIIGVCFTFVLGVFMDTSELINLYIFGSYFALIAASFVAVFASILSSKGFSDLISGRASIFLRAALGGLVCTWYFMFQFMKWSYLSFARWHAEPTIPQWLVHTSLFEQAWRAVCDGTTQWWWSSWICTSAVFLCALIWYQCSKRGIKYGAAYMLLGQLVAISVALALFLTAVYMHEPVVGRAKPKAGVMLYVPLVAAMAAMAVMPQYAGTEYFMPTLGMIHLAVIVPLFFVPKDSKTALGIPFRYLIAVLAILAGVVHYDTTKAVVAALPSDERLPLHLATTIISHPAQASVSLDVIWVAITSAIWLISTGSPTIVAFKTTAVVVAAGVALARSYGVNWLFIASLLPIAALLGVAAIGFIFSRYKARNDLRRAAVLAKLGIYEYGVVPGTADVPPHMAKRHTVVGFWHPYCNAGGGGERVLWTAIAWLQREHPEVVVLVYSGDYPAASKDEILAKVNDRFSIKLSPKTLDFVPLPSRHLISDTYWKRFTLLGQSIGSVYLAWEGLCGPDGVWGDIFIDSMGYGFVLPFVRLIAGSEVAIGSYTHYPTVSSDMVRRVRERSEGVENAGASKSALRTWVKLVYYRIFTSLYSTSLLYSQHTMTNSSWTQAHIQSLLNAGRSSLGARILLMDDSTIRHRESRGEASEKDRSQCEVVFPPCDTTELMKLGNLDARAREVVSLAQFRPEKDHAKQITALAMLFELHPQYKDGAERIHLTLMGGSRGPADEARLASLRRLASELGVQDHVTFLVNAPYPEIVSRLGSASVGLNTMQDEHFGINVVEFMAAGLIPIVHASAGPLLDIVVPYNGQRTGFHATDAKSFAVAIHEALSLPRTQQLAMRKAARALASSKFSEAAFERSFARGWERLDEIAGGGRDEPEAQALR